MLATMGRKKREQAAEEPAQTVSFRAPDSIIAVLDAISDENRHTRSVTVLILVEEALKARGRFPQPRKSK